MPGPSRLSGSLGRHRFWPCPTRAGSRVSARPSGLPGKARLAPRQPIDQVLNSASAHLRSPRLGDFTHQCVPVLGRQELERGLRSGGESQRCRKADPNLPGRPGNGRSFPAPIGASPRYRGQSRRLHPPLLGQPADVPDVARGPAAAVASRGEPVSIGELIPALNLTVDPTLAESLIERLRVAEGGRSGVPLLGQHQPYASRIGMVLVQPTSPGDGIVDHQFGKFIRHEISTPALADSIVSPSAPELHPKRVRPSSRFGRRSILARAGANHPARRQTPSDRCSPVRLRACSPDPSAGSGRDNGARTGGGRPSPR